MISLTSILLDMDPRHRPTGARSGARSGTHHQSQSLDVAPASFDIMNPSTWSRVINSATQSSSDFVEEGRYPVFYVAPSQYPGSPVPTHNFGNVSRQDEGV